MWQRECPHCRPPPASAPSASAPPATAAVLTLEQQASAYLAAVAPANKAVGIFNARVTPSSSQEDAAREGELLANALEANAARLSRIAFTGQSVVDIRALLTAFGAIVGDLRAIRNQSDFSLGSFSTVFSRDEGAAAAAVTLIRADLGLPPRT